MLARIRHRGPDDLGHVQSGPTWLGHTRLSIVDVVGGHQPLSGSHDRWLVGNGEIYNHADLRAELGEDRFTTASDNETMLAVIEAWGTAGIGRLRGMFAFVIADGHGGVLAARDPLGIKPLYWAREGDRVVFASELRAFDPALRARVATFPPGHWWRPGGDPVPFADLGAPVGTVASKDAARTEVRAAIVTAVERRMMADVGVGVLLSGGLDSSIVAAVAARAAAKDGRRVLSFAVGTPGSADLAAARLVADHLGLEHHERVYDAAEAAAAIDDVVAATESYEPSLIRSAVPNWFVAELAARHVKVVLTGEGADELFAGYDYLRRYDDHDELDRELLRSVRGLHHLNLQRCDRVTMAHGLEARVPFLDLDVVTAARRVPPGWKLLGEAGQEKRLLREAFDGWLPDEVLWRTKVQFGDGSGAADVLGDWVARRPAGNADGINGLPEPRSAEEGVYQEVFARVLDGIPVDRVLGRFATA